MRLFTHFSSPCFAARQEERRAQGKEEEEKAKKQRKKKNTKSHPYSFLSSHRLHSKHLSQDQAFQRPGQRNLGSGEMTLGTDRESAESRRP